MYPPRVTDVEVAGESALRVTFADGAVRRVYLAGLIERLKALEPLRDPDRFREVRVDAATHSVAWPGGIDINPDALYGLEARKGIDVHRVKSRRSPTVSA
jgi:hypothetical protein